MRMLECRVCDIPVVCVTQFLDHKDMLLYVTKIICNIHWNHNETYNLVVYLFIFNNYETINDQKIIQHKGLFSGISYYFDIYRSESDCK